MIQSRFRHNRAWRNWFSLDFSGASRNAGQHAINSSFYERIAEGGIYYCEYLHRHMCADHRSENKRSRLLWDNRYHTSTDNDRAIVNGAAEVSIAQKSVLPRPGVGAGGLYDRSQGVRRDTLMKRTNGFIFGRADNRRAAETKEGIHDLGERAIKSETSLPGTVILPSRN
jgi:hypothetical protein